MEQIEQTTRTYASFPLSDFKVDIVETEQLYKAWIYSENYGTKILMFGSGKEYTSYDEFLELVDKNFCAYAIDYIKEVMNF